MRPVKHLIWKYRVFLMVGTMNWLVITSTTLWPYVSYHFFENYLFSYFLSSDRRALGLGLA